MGLFSSIAGIFGAVQERSANEEAERMAAEAAAKAQARSDELHATAKTFLDAGTSGIGLMQKYLTKTEGLDTGTGLSGADRIAYEDASKLLNENMVSTGNLRSGAAAYGQAQLLSRVVAGADARRFGNEVQKLQLLFSGSDAMTRVGSSVGVSLEHTASGLQGQAGQLNLAAANFEVGQGVAMNKAITSGGKAGDEAISLAALYAKG